jgi:hypothetical protein
LHDKITAPLLAMSSGRLPPEKATHGFGSGWRTGIKLRAITYRAFALGVEMTINVDDLPDEIKTFGEISKIK